MAQAHLTKNGRCLITGRTNVPMINTGKSIPNHGTVYVSIDGIFNILKEAGWIDPRETKNLKDRTEAAEKAADNNSKKAASYDELIENITQHIDIEPEVITKVNTVHRAPTDDEVEAWIRRNGGDHPAVKAAQPADPGSTEAWYALYGRQGRAKGKPTPTPVEPTNEADTDDGEASDATPHEPSNAAPATVDVEGTEVNLDEVLALSVKDIEAYVEGHPEQLQHALVKREIYNAKSNDKEPRKSLIEALEGPTHTPFSFTTKEEE